MINEVIIKALLGLNTSFLDKLPENVTSGISGLITIIKVIGIIVT